MQDPTSKPTYEDGRWKPPRPLTFSRIRLMTPRGRERVTNTCINLHFLLTRRSKRFASIFSWYRCFDINCREIRAITSPERAAMSRANISTGAEGNGEKKGLAVTGTGACHIEVSYPRRDLQQLGTQQSETVRSAELLSSLWRWLVHCLFFRSFNIPQ